MGKKRKVTCSFNRLEHSLQYLTFFKRTVENYAPEVHSILDASIPASKRAELFEQLLPIDEIEEYSWAIPDQRALRIIQHFSPIVEIGAGKGYWAAELRLLETDVQAFDCRVSRDSWTHVIQGGPEVLSRFPSHALLLCYPDDFESSSESLSLNCLEKFKGEIILTVGEWFGTSALADNPYGKSFGQDFQEQLSLSFHKLLQVPLPSWRTSSDVLMVWKRSRVVEVDDILFRDTPEEERIEKQPMAVSSLRSLLDL